MDSITVSAKTVDDALTEASIQLGTSRDNIEFTVLDEGSKGFFGIGGRKATIEAKKKITDEDLMKEIFDEKPEKPKKEYKKDYKKENRQEYKQEKKEFKEQKKDVKKEAKPEDKKEAKKEKESKKEFKKELKKEEPLKEYKKEQRKDRRKENEMADDMKEPEKKEIAQEDFISRIPRTPADPEEAQKRAVDFIKEVMRAMNMDVEIKTAFEEGTLCVDIEGEDMGIMIGKRGQTLDSLQYLTSLVVNKGKSSYVRVKVDTEDYRNRRKATLENLAKNIALKVKKTRKPVFLEPMNPYERRIIHSALQNDPYVTTHSEGDEPYRKVVVTPKKDHDRGHGYSSGRYNNRRNHYNRHATDLESEQSEFAKDAVKIERNEEE